ncbi:MAG: light-harvesting protein [Betaproteobacteria bacterium]
MIYGKIWCVVKPSVGLPLFLGGVAVTSLVVHFAILNNTTWFARFLNGSGPAPVAATAEAAVPVAPPAAKK